DRNRGGQLTRSPLPRDTGSTCRFAIEYDRMKTLGELALTYGTDKGPNGHNYTAIYARYLEPLRSTASNLLEIGVGRGASIRMWHDYFPGAVLSGADCGPPQAEPPGDRTQLFSVDESRPDTLQVLAAYAPFDVAIDDGSHAPEHQILTFQTLFPFVRPGGIY